MKKRSIIGIITIAAIAVTAGRPFGLTDLSSARGCCTCGYCFN